MKKKFILLLLIFLVGCTTTLNTPTKKVENFLNKYKRLDNNIMISLESIIEKDSDMNKGEKEAYKELIKKGYQNLSYKIDDERINNTYAEVDVSIEVLDYKKAITTSKEKVLEELDNESILDSMKKFIDYKLEEMKKVNTKTKYELTFYLTEENGIWKINNLKEADILKIHGMF